MIAFTKAGARRSIAPLLACPLLASLATPALSQDQPPPPPAAIAPQPRASLRVIAIPSPLPLPGQLKPLKAAQRPRPLIDPKARVNHANAEARVEPDRVSWLNAIQQYPYTEGALYQVYTAPGQVTDIVLQQGEALAGSGPVAAGDTVRWIIGDTESGAGPTKRMHIIVKPTRPDLETNLVINTDRRTYHLELHATPATYMAAVSWTYPQDELIALRKAETQAASTAPVAAGIDPRALNFGYQIDGDRPDWRPVRAFDDGRQAYIEFPATIGTGEMPPLFVVGADGKDELVNYRVRGRYMIVDRLFGVAELRLGTKKSDQRVRITRKNSKRGQRS
ncbi:MAG TPA: P-type conjugative transfer protein TrbG [Devosia sp.]|nr:P-type conjugative transfer protein TrbG [Devosia sp.]